MLTATAHKIAAAVAFALLTVWLLVGSWQLSPHSNQATQKQNAQQTNGQTKHDEPWLTKDAAGFFTFLLVGVGAFQVGLFWVQLRLIRKSLGPAEQAAKAAQDAAEAAKINAEAIMRSERAYVTGGPGHRRQHTEKSGKLYDTHIVFTGMNTGKTPAFTKKIDWGVCKEADWPVIGKNWPAVETSKSETWEDVLQPLMRREDIVSARFTASFVEPDGGPWVCWGRIFYRDIFGNDYETAWKHRVIRKDGLLETEALPGSYSAEWEKPKP
jgi:hypothetical protein